MAAKREGQWRLTHQVQLAPSAQQQRPRMPAWGAWQDRSLRMQPQLTL